MSRLWRRTNGRTDGRRKMENRAVFWIESETAIKKSFHTKININDLPFSKGFMKFGWPEPSKRIFDFWNFLLVEKAFDPVCKGPSSLIKFWHFRRTSFLFDNARKFYGVKSVLFFFQTYNWEEPNFSTRSYVHWQIYIKIRGPGQIGRKSQWERNSWRWSMQGALYVHLWSIEGN